MIAFPVSYAFDQLPVGVMMIGRRWSEASLIKYAYAFEQATMVRKAPQFLPSLDL
jgi:amidase